MKNENYTLELRRKDFWEYFVKDLDKNVNELGEPKHHPLVARSLSRLKDNLGDKENKTLEKFLNAWRKQGKEYEHRITDEVNRLCEYYKRQLDYADGMIGEEYLNLLDVRELLISLINESQGISPEKAKQFREELAALDKELKEKTVPLPKGHIQSDKPWYENRWPVYEAENYKQKEKK